MHKAFYNLKENPIGLKESPRFLYLRETHKQALAALISNIERAESNQMLLLRLLS
jgi:type II secretory pathway predicted ATPase ExeA